MSRVEGQRQTFFWNGEKYVFERNAYGNWKVIYQDNSIIPEVIIKQLETL